MREFPKNEVTQDQLYAYWTLLNENAWRLDLDQVKSVIAVLSKSDDIAVNIIPTHEEDGISIFAFALKEIMDTYSDQVTEIAMDSTCKHFHPFNISIFDPNLMKGKPMRLHMSYTPLLQKQGDVHCHWPSLL